jgi:hypothetical protein
MGRVSIALMLAVWLVPAHSAAQSNSLPSTAFGSDLFRAGASTYSPTYDRLPRFSRQVVPGWYGVAGASDQNDPSPVTSRYMARGDIDPVPPYSVPRYSPVRPRIDVVPSSAGVYVDGSYIGTVSDVNYRALYQNYLDRALYRISYRPTFVPVYYSVPVSYSRYRPWSFGYVEPVVQTSAPVYVIPGCYMGDAPPLRPEKLPPGCKLENLRRVYH